LKRISIILALTLALCLVFVGAAYANFGPHGGYVSDTDSCAGCHRAHTSFSTVGWTDTWDLPHTSALLVGNASTMTEFCEACHGDTAPGASTNVASGVFDSGPSAAGAFPTGGVVTTGSADGPAWQGTTAGTPTGSTSASGPVDLSSVVTAYKTGSVFNAPLNGGGFNRMPDPYAWQANASISYVKATSAHKMDVSGPLWGAGGSAGTPLYAGGTALTCTDCHDPHGAANYRLLKAVVNGNPVGGYTGTGGLNPDPFVFSNEEGYPLPGSPGAPNGGWLKHQDGADQMAAYRPNYTDTTGTPIYSTYSASNQKSMSVWCAGCHTDYNSANAATAINYNYDPYLPAPGFPGAGSPVGAKDYHRHAVDVSMGNQELSIAGGRTLYEAVIESATWIPLENTSAGSNVMLGCLTCHRAHGSSVLMTGYAAAHLETMTINTTGTIHTIYMPVRDTVPGVDPDKGSYNGVNNQGTSALLRANNRGVCERCHNK